MRPETGSMQFGDDWPGVFIRGDEALYIYGFMMEVDSSDSLTNHVIARLVNILESCHAESADPQRMKSIHMCVKGPCSGCKHYEMEKFSPKILDYVTSCNNLKGPRFRQQVRHDDGCGEWEGS